MSLITLTDPQSPISEAYRRLRTNLSFYSLDDALNTLVVTSPAPEAHAAEAAANLAVTMAQSGKRTVLVECDLRRPQLHAFFQASAEPGLTNSLLEDAAPPLVKTNVPHLQFLPPGPLPPNPADLLGSRRMDQLIATLHAEADFIIFNAPPVVAVTDATVLGSKVDGVLLIVRSGKTRRDHAQQAKELLEKANVRIVGAAMTDAPKDTSIGDYYG